MKKPIGPKTVWSKKHIRPCPTGKCKHDHIRGLGPCTESGCGCHGKHVGLPPSKSRRSA